MIEQLKTIREALQHGIKAINHLGGAREAMPLHDAMPALAQLEAMAEQEPVAKLHDDGYWTPMKTEAGRALNDRLMRAGSPSIDVYAVPVAQQPQARPDFTDEWTGYLKDGETPFERFLRERKDLQSVLKLYQRVLEENERLKAQQPQADQSLRQDALQSLAYANGAKAGWNLAIADDEAGFARIMDQVPEAIRILKQTRAVVSQNQPDVRDNAACVSGTRVEQPQAETDNHEAQGQLEFLDKKNNALSAAIRKVMARLADLLDEDQFKEIEEIVSFAGVQPQAEEVPLTHVLVPVDEPTDEMVDAACAAVDGLCRVDFVRAYAAAFAHLKAGYRDESYWCGWNAAIKFQQAEAVPSDVVLVPAAALRWLFGEDGEFECPPDRYVCGKPPAYWWRRVFREKIAAMKQGGGV